MTVILITRKHHPIPVVNLANTGMVHFTQGNENGASWGSNLHDISAILPQHRKALNICLWGKWACSLHILVLYLHDSSYKK